MTGVSRQPPPGGGPPEPLPTTTPSQPTMTPERTGDGHPETPCRMRSFEEIMNEEKKNRNILIVKITKIVTIVNGKEVKDKNLFMEDIGELFFEVMKVKVDDCAGLSLTTSRYDTKQINLKPSIIYGL